MAINIIERAVTPYNGSVNKVSNKGQYSLYAPAASVNKPGMAGYDPKYFSVREQIVGLSNVFLRSIIQLISAYDYDPTLTGVIYTDYAADVIAQRLPNGMVSHREVSGDLLVLGNDFTHTELLFAQGTYWSRVVEFDDNGKVVLTSEFEPAFDKLINTNNLAIGAVKSDNIANDAVTAPKIAKNAIREQHVDDNAIARKAIKNGAVDETKLAPNAVTEEKIANNSVTEDKIANNSVSTIKLSTHLLELIKRTEADSFVGVEYEPSNGILRFITGNGAVSEVDLPLELMISGGRYEERNQSLILVLSNGEEIEIPLEDLTREFVEYIEDIRNSIYSLQKAPPLSTLTEAIVLTTPTLATIAKVI